MEKGDLVYIIVKSRFITPDRPYTITHLYDNGDIGITDNVNKFHVFSPEKYQYIDIKPGDTVEATDNVHKDSWKFGTYVGKNPLSQDEYFVAYNDNPSIAQSCVLCRKPKTKIVTRQEIAEWKGVPVEFLTITD